MTALIDTPALSPVAVSAAVPAYVGSRPIVRTTLTPAGAAPMDLGCSEMALALHHCGAALSLSLTPDEVAALVAHGAALLGLGRLRDMDQRSNTLGLRCADRIDTAADRREERRIWSHGPRRRDIASGLASNLSSYAHGEPFHGWDRIRADRERTRR